MLIAIAHNEVTDESPIDEKDVLEQIDGVSGALERLGHKAVTVPCSVDLAAFRARLLGLRPDAVFNLVESLEGHGRLIHLAPSLMDAMGLIYTGCPAESIFLTSNKVLAKQWLRSAGLPTPAWVGPFPARLPVLSHFPPDRITGSGMYVVKALWEHASFNLGGDNLLKIETTARVHGTLEERAAKLAGACFAEEYIDGREFNVAVLDGPDGPETLPVSEILFENYPDGAPRMVDYKAKWIEDSFEYKNTPRNFDFTESEKELLEELSRLALVCWRLFGLRGYARVDFRVDSAGRPWILEVNANPCITPEAGFWAMLEQADISYDTAVKRILEAALAPETMRERKSPAPSKTTSAKKEEITLRFETRHTDIDLTARMTADTGFFTADEVEVAAELVEDNLIKGPVKSGYHFIFAERGGETLGFTAYGPIACTDTGWTVYWIAVAPGMQRHGIGRRLLAEVEKIVKAEGGTKVYVETAGRPQYQKTREFYERCGYTIAETLKDFYTPGDDRVTYLKNWGQAENL